MSTADIRAELRELVSGRVGIADGVLPPLIFVGANAVWGLVPAAVLGVGTAVAISVWRLFGGRPLRFALAGLFGTVLAAILALRSGSADGYFLPGIFTGAATTAALVASTLAKRPFVAWTSWLARGWPIGWYWHPNVRPAYARASWIWASFFALRTLIQWQLYTAGETVALGVARVVMGWPLLLVLLVTTYVLGRRWLVSIGGPSVEEFESGAPPPWQGQERGF
jgi:hypothetical protein